MFTDISSKNMDYLELIGVLSKDIGIVDIIDSITGVHEYQKVTHGQSTMVMIYNMLAILQKPLYLITNPSVFCTENVIPTWLISILLPGFF